MSLQQTLKDMSINDLKALVYDHLAVIENSKATIQMINQELTVKMQAQKSAPPVEEPAV